MKRVEMQRTNEMDRVATGLLDHPMYKQVCGFIDALNSVLVWCEDIDKDMRQGK